MEANTEDNPQSASGGNTISAEEEEILLVGHPNLRIKAQGARPAQSLEGWKGYISHLQPTLGLRRGRPHSRSPPFCNNPEVLCLSPPSPLKKEVGVIVRRGA